MYLITTGALVGILLLSIFFVVKQKVFGDLDDLLNYEAIKHTKEIKVEDNSIIFINKSEMLEREHREADANPVFIQLVDKDGILMDKSPNLKEGFLVFDPDHKGDIDGSRKLNDRRIRQTQVNVTVDGIIVGHIITAVSSENAEQLISTLRTHFYTAFPVMLIVLFFVTRFLAGRSIRPVSEIIRVSNAITTNSLNSRILVPEQKDELSDLANSINSLLERIQRGTEREKQFASDAAHELRTPLAVLKGTLEVLIRKPRTESEYQEKIAECIGEIDRLTAISEQLLELAKMEHDQNRNTRNVNLVDLIQQTINRFQTQIELKNIHLEFKHPEILQVTINTKLMDLIVENLLSNAVKYSEKNGQIDIELIQSNQNIYFKVRDNGIGIPEEKLKKIFDPFFRGHSLKNQEIKGTGLGLSIVNKACEQLNAKITIDSVPENGTEVKISFLQPTDCY